MNPPRRITLDGNEAVASVAHRTNEVIALYPITPASPMGEWCDEWTAHGRRNIWGHLPDVIEMQSEAGAIGAVHGAFQAGSLTTTFTASQGLLLMIPNMYKIAGELTSFCMHVATRSVATHALSIFCDHSDVMACRQTGFALLCSSSVQEAHDFACIGQAATLKSRVPFLHFFDGFRTSHEVAKIEELSDDDLRSLLDEESIAAHRRRAYRPTTRSSAGRPKTPTRSSRRAKPRNSYLRRPARRSSSRSWTGSPIRPADIITFRLLTATREAERVLVLMGSAAETAQETVEHLNRTRRESRRAQGSAVPAVLGQGLRRRPAAPPPGQLPCSTAPRSRAPSASRSTSTCRRPPGSVRRKAIPFPAGAWRHRRALRPVVQGVHSGDGQGRL